MPSWLTAAACILRLAAAKWQAVYAPDLSEGYLQLSNGTLYQLNVTSKDVSGQSVVECLQQLESPPANASLVIDNDKTLYAVWGTKGCGQSPIQISTYDSKARSWTQESKSGEDWYEDAATVWFDRSNSNIYVYGGHCGTDIGHNFYQYDVRSKQFNTASATPMPREMAQAQAISLDGASTVVLGGRANSGWLSMQQVAFWEYNSWTYRAVSNSTGIDSRESPLLLPLWNSTGHGSGSVGSQIQQVLVVGGTVDGRAAQPPVLALQFNTANGWSWSKPDISAGSFVATLYETVVVVDDKDSGSGSGTGTVSLFDSAHNFKAASRVQVPLATSSSAPRSKAPLPKASIAAMSTIIPLIVIAAAVVTVWMWWRKRQQRKTFLPRKSQIMSPSVLSVTSGNWEKPPPSRYDTHVVAQQNPFDDGHDITEQSDIQILVHKRRHALRVMNPDEPESELSNSADKLSGRSPLVAGPVAGPRLAAGPGHRRGESTMSTLSRRSVSSRKASEEFDFSN